IQSSHDGSASVSISFLAVRPSDNSFLPMTGFGTRHTLAYRHTKGAKLRIEEVSKLLEIKNKFFQVLKENSEKLVGTPMTLEQAEAFVNKFVQMPEDPAKPIPGH